MEDFKVSNILQLKQVLSNGYNLGTIKKPVSVTPAKEDYYDHIAADSILIGMRNNNINTLVSTALTQYNDLSTRREKHMYKALKTPIRLDTLLEEGYSYLVVRVPNYIATYEYNDYKVDLNNITYNGCHGQTMWISGIKSDGKIDYARTNPVVIADKYFGAGLSFSSLNPFNVVAAIEKPLDVNVGNKSAANPKRQFNLVYFYQSIDLDYVVNKLDCVYVALATIGFSGEFYFSDADYEAGILTTFSEEAPMDLTYYYL